MIEKKSSKAWKIFNDEPIGLQGCFQYLSFADLQKIPEFRLALMRQDLETFERILWENGLDIKKGYNIVKCLHRPRTSHEVYDGFKVDSIERLDPAWLNSGAASEEAYFYAQSKDMRDELIKLDPHKEANKREWDEDVECTVNLEFYD